MVVTLCVARRKRVVRVGNREVSLGDFYLTDFVTPGSVASSDVANTAWQRVSMLYQRDPQGFVSLLSAIGLYNIYVKEIWNVVNVSVGYRYDDQNLQTPDFWLLPNESWFLKQGDCEDTTFLLLSAIYRVKTSWRGDPVSDQSVEYGVIGFYRDYSGSYYGHAYVIRRSPRISSEWLWVETTFDSEVPQSLWYIWNPNVLIPVYFFTNTDCYRIDRDYRMLGLTQDYVKLHEQYIKMMIDYVEVGKRTSVKWMHKKTRTPSCSTVSIIRL